MVFKPMTICPWCESQIGRYAYCQSHCKDCTDHYWSPSIFIPKAFRSNQNKITVKYKETNEETNR